MARDLIVRSCQGSRSAVCGGVPKVATNSIGRNQLRGTYGWTRHLEQVLSCSWHCRLNGHADRRRPLHVRDDRWAGGLGK
jgi:hypothetical protein